MDPIYNLLQMVNVLSKTFKLKIKPVFYFNLYCQIFILDFVTIAAEQPKTEPDRT